MIQQLSFWFAAAFWLHLFLAALFDVWAMYLTEDHDTISKVTRDSWLRYPAVTIIAAFWVVHFWRRP